MCKLNKKGSFALRAQGEIINESTNKEFITFNFQFSVFNLKDRGKEN